MKREEFNNVKSGDVFAVALTDSAHFNDAILHKAIELGYQTLEHDGGVLSLANRYAKELSKEVNTHLLFSTNNMALGADIRTCVIEGAKMLTHDEFLDLEKEDLFVSYANNTFSEYEVGGDNDTSHVISNKGLTRFVEDSAPFVLTSVVKNENEVSIWTNGGSHVHMTRDQFNDWAEIVNQMFEDK